MKIALPVWLGVALSLLAGLLSVLNQVIFDAGAQWSAAITYGLLIVAGLGIPAVTGAAFQAALAKLIPAKYLHVAHGLLVALAGAGTVALTLNSWSDGVHAVIAGVVAVLLGLGFGPPVTSLVAKIAKRAPAAIAP